MTIDSADVFWIETGAMQGEERYILEIAEHLANFFEEKQGIASQIAINHQGNVWSSQNFKRHESDHYTPQWRVFLPTAFSQHSQSYYPDKVARFEKEMVDTAWHTGRCYDLELRNPSHSDVDAWRQEAEAHGETGTTGQGDKGREYGYF